MNVCHDSYKMFNAESEISPCCDCSSELRLMESSSPAPFCSKFSLTLLLKNPGKRICSVKKPTTQYDVKSWWELLWWTCSPQHLWRRPLRFLHWWSLCDCSSVPRRQLHLHSRRGSCSGHKRFIVEIFLSPEIHWQIDFQLCLLSSPACH